MRLTLTNKALVFALCLVTTACSENGIINSVVFTQQSAQIQISPSVQKFGSRSVQSNTYQTFTLSNTGSLRANITGVDTPPAPFAFKENLPFPGLGGTCTGTYLDPKQSCTFVLTYHPTEVGDFSANWKVNWINNLATKGNTATTLSLSGSGVNNATLAFSEDGVNALDNQVYDFGTIGINTTVTKRFIVQYFGLWQASSVVFTPGAVGYSFEGNSSFTFQSIDCPSNNISAPCDVVVSLNASTVGDQSGWASLLYNNGDAPATVKLNVHATVSPSVVPAVLSISEPSCNGGAPLTAGQTCSFGNQVAGGLAVKTFTVTRAGTLPASSAVLSAFTSPAFTKTGGSCSDTISGTCTIQVTFNPSSGGSYASPFTLAYFDGQSQAQVNFNVSGAAVSPAGLSLTALQTTGFGVVSINDTKDLTFSLANQVANSANASNIRLSTTPSVFSILSGNACQGVGEALASNTSCQFTVRFQPTDPRQFTGSIALTYFDGTQDQTTQLIIVGTGTSNPTLRFSPSTYDYQGVVVGGQENQVFTLLYFGSDPATLQVPTLPSSWNFPGGFPGTGGTCTTNIQNSCRIVVQFAPTAQSSFTAPLLFPYTYPAGSSSTLLTLQGLGATPANLVWTASTAQPLNFGSVSVNEPVYLTASMTNTGGVDAVNIAPSALVAPLSISSNSCAANRLAPGATCAFSILYFPRATGPTSELLTVGYSSNPLATQSALSAQSLSLNISGNGVANATLIFALTQYDFGTLVVGDTKSTSLVLHFYGLAAATGVSARLLSAGPFSTSAPASTISGDISLTATFAPTAPGSFFGTLEVTYNDGTGVIKTADIQLLGAAVTPAHLTLTSPASLPYVFSTLSWGDSNIAVFTVINDGGSTANITQSSPSAPFSVVASNCAPSLPANASCSLSIKFAPTSATGTANQNGSVQLSYYTNLSGGRTVSGAPLNITFSGIGSDRAILKFTVTSLALPSAIVGGSTSMGTVSVQYFGGKPAAVSSISGMGGDFIFGSDPTNRGSAPLYGFSSGTCSASITASCSFPVYFAPLSTGTSARNATLTLNYNDGYSTAAPITLALSASATTPAVLAISPSSYTYVGILPVGQSVSAVFTVTKTGGANATSVSGTNTLPFRFTGGSYPGTGGNCSSTISANCQISIEFIPTATGVYTLPVTLSYQDGAHGQATNVLLSGQAKQIAVLAVTVPSSGFADLPIVESAPQTTPSETLTITLTNNGTAAASSVSISLGTGQFFTLLPDAVQPCGSTLAAGASCKMGVVFGPNRPGAFPVDFLVSYFNQISSLNLDQTLNANGVVPIHVSANGSHSCVRNKLGKVQCWGSNNYGQLGIGSTAASVNSPQAAVDLGGNYYALSVTSGMLHTCALLSDNSLKCWGDNTYGELGRGNASAIIGLQPQDMGSNLPSVQLGSGVVVKQLALGYSNTCAIVTTAASGIDNVKCWGQNQSGQLGLGDANTRGLVPSDMGDSLPYVHLGQLATQISTKASHVCAVLQDGTAKCWGSNFYGQLGLKDSKNRGDQAGEMGTSLPAIDVGGQSVLSIVAGGGFTCALLSSLQAKCWGKNGAGDETGNLGTQWCEDNNNNLGLCGSGPYSNWIVGYGTEASEMGTNLPFVSIGSGRTIKAIDAGTSHVCVLLDNNRLKCWGDNTYGQLGLGDSNDRGNLLSDMGDSLPLLDFGSPNVVSEYSIGHYHGCVIQKAPGDLIGALKCWGENQFGDLGLGNNNNYGDQANEMGAALPAVGL